MADLLGLPFDTTVQVALTPVAYTIGTDFKPASRADDRKYIPAPRFRHQLGDDVGTRPAHAADRRLVSRADRREPRAAGPDEAFGPLGLDEVTLHTEVANERSRALARRLGFVEEGVLRAAVAFPDGRRDDVAYGLLASEWHRGTE